MSRDPREIARDLHEELGSCDEARGFGLCILCEDEGRCRATAAIAAAIEQDRAEREAWRPTHRHYKGGYYRQIATAGHSETGESLAIYDDDRGNLWAGPLKIFVETLPNGQRRFEPLPSPPQEGQP